MRVDYDRNSDSLTLVLNGHAVYERDKIGPGVLADFAVDGSLIGLQITDASSRIDDPESLQVIARQT